MFSRARQLLDAVERRKEITMQDVMNIFDDLYEDVVTDQGVSFEELPEGDPDEVAASTIRMANRIRRLYKKNPGIFSSDRFQDRWEAASERLEEVEKRLAEIQKEEEDWREKRKETEQLREKCAELEEKAARIRTEHKQALEDLQRLEKEENELSGTVAGAEKERRRYETQLIPKVRSELEEARNYLKNAQVLKGELDQQLADIQEEYQKEKQETEQQEERVKAVFRSSQQRLQEARENLENQISENQRKQSELGTVIESLQRELGEKEKENQLLEEQRSSYQIRYEAAISEISKAGEQTKQWELKCLQAEKIRDQEYQNTYRLMEQHKKTEEEMNEKKKLWNSVWMGLKEDRAGTAGADPEETSLEKLMNDKISQINREISEFERGCASLLRTMEKRMED